MTINCKDITFTCPKSHCQHSFKGPNIEIRSFMVGRFLCIDYNER